MNSTIQPLLLSLKPHYADLIFGHLKTAELRRRIASDVQNRDVFIYVSSPIMALRGGFRVGEVWQGAPEKVWSIVQQRAGVNKQDFDDYFEGQVNAKALEITQIWECETPVSLNELRGTFSNFVVPQSWRYVRDNEVHFLQQLKTQHKKPTQQHQEDTRQSFSSSMQLQCAQ